jgi:iron complex outermembrane receptor protein/hemoglobin/transferrin/lactoferrin receptor protein
MRIDLVLMVALLAGAFAHVGYAQAADPFIEESAEENIEPALPPVVVRPDAEAPEPAPTPTEVASPTAATESPYPSLSEQSFGAGQWSALDSVVRGEKSLFDLPAFGTIIDRQTLEEKQATDMFRALQNEVGVLMQRTAAGHSSPFIRGLTGQQVLMLVDGIRLNTSIFRSGPNQYFNTIDPGQIERIEIVRGPESVLWGSDALGGVINIVTRSADFERGNYAGGGFKQYFGTADRSSYSRGNIEGWVGQAGVFGGASYLNVNDLYRGGGKGIQPFTNYDQYAADLKLNYAIGCDSMLTVAFQHFEQEDVPRSDRFAPFAFGPPAGTPRPTFADPQQRDLMYIRWQGLASNALFDGYSTTFSYMRNKEGSRELRSPTRTDLGEFDLDTFGYTLTLARDLNWAGRLTYGVDFYHDDLSAWRRRLNPVTGVTTPDNPQFPNGSRYQRTGAFLSWDVDVTERLTATTGLRYENIDAGGTLNEVVGTPIPFSRTYHDWIVSFGLLHRTTDWMHTFGSVSEGFRAPNLDDLAVDRALFQGQQEVPSLNVRPENAWTYEVGLKFDLPRLRLQISEYWTDLQNNILRQAVDEFGNPVPNTIGPYGTLVPGSDTFIRANFDSYVNGTELAGEYQLIDEWWLYGNFWYTYGQNLDTEEPLGRIPPVQGILGARWRDAQRRHWFDVYTWLVARQDRYAVVNNVDARYPVGGTPAYATLNMRAGTTWGCCSRHRLSLSLENITNSPYRALGSGVDGPGFNAMLGYEWIR